MTTLSLAAVLLLTTAATPPVDGNVDVSKSVITWAGKKVLGAHHGTINLKEASLKWEGDMLKGGHFVIDMSSIVCEDLAGTPAQAKLEGHLKSADFFSVEAHPTARLDLVSVVHRGTPGSYKIVGDLTIKGITKPVKFNAAFSEDGGMKVATAQIVVDRSEYDVRYGSGSFFDSLGDKTIYDEFEMNVKLVLN